MYYLLFILLYLLSLLPFFILYRISDLIYILLYYIIGYRKKIVSANLAIAFPEKTAAERTAISKQFYINLVDTFIESIKMISMSGKQFDKRCTIDADLVNELAAKGKSIQLHSGHQMNWEYANWIGARNVKTRWVGIYHPITNKAVHKIFYNMREKFGTQLVSTREFKTVMHAILKNQYAIGLASDQNTSPEKGYWMYFFNKPVPFITGPEKGALKNNTAVIFVNFVKKKRGYYHFETKLVTEAAAGMPEGELTRMYRDFLEEAIRKQPDNYLWSHRRWRYDYNNQFESRWMDTRPKP